MLSIHFNDFWTLLRVEEDLGVPKNTFGAEGSTGKRFFKWNFNSNKKKTFFWENHKNKTKSNKTSSVAMHRKKPKQH